METKYVGSRYIPIFLDDHNPNVTYEPISVVDSAGMSYVSKKPVPQGVQIDNAEYWKPIFGEGKILKIVPSIISMKYYTEGSVSNAVLANRVGDIEIIKKPDNVEVEWNGVDDLKITATGIGSGELKVRDKESLQEATARIEVIEGQFEIVPLLDIDTALVPWTGIELPFMVKENYNVTIDYMQNQNDYGVGKFIFADNTGLGDKPAFWLENREASKQIIYTRAAGGNIYDTNLGGVSSGGRYVISINEKLDSELYKLKVTKNNETIYSPNAFVPNGASSIKLLPVRTQGTTAIDIKLFRFTVKDRDTGKKILELLPCKNLGTGKHGLLETNSRAFVEVPVKAVN